LPTKSRLQEKMSRTKTIITNFRELIEKRPDLKKELKTLSKEDLFSIITEREHLFVGSPSTILSGLRKEKGIYIEKLKPFSLITPFQESCYYSGIYFLGSSRYALIPTSSGDSRFLDLSLKKVEKCPAGVEDLIEDLECCFRATVRETEEFLTSEIPQLQALAKLVQGYKFSVYWGLIKSRATLDTYAAFQGKFSYKLKQRTRK